MKHTIRTRTRDSLAAAPVAGADRADPDPVEAVPDKVDTAASELDVPEPFGYDLD